MNKPKKGVVGKRCKARVVRQAQMQIWLQVLCHRRAAELVYFRSGTPVVAVGPRYSAFPTSPHLVCGTAAAQQPDGRHASTMIGFPDQSKESDFALCLSMLTKCDNSKGRRFLNNMWRLGVMLKVLATRRDVLGSCHRKRTHPTAGSTDLLVTQGSESRPS